MANPVKPGTFDAWITNRISFKTLAPKSGSTGDFDRWITSRIYFEDYTEAEEARQPRYGFILYQDPGID